MNRFFAAAAAAALSVPLTAPPLAAAGVLPDVESFVLFGDSGSDPGNIFAENAAELQLLFPPDGIVPWFPENQVTNGDVWATQLGLDFASGRNFAFSGGRASDNGDEDDDLPEQIQSFRNSGIDKTGIDKAIISLGSNDLLDVNPLQLAFTPLAAAPAIGAAVSAIGTGVDDLLLEGISKFHIFGVPDVARAPAVQQIAGLLGGLGPQFLANATQAAQDFNTALQALVGGINAVQPGTVHYVDTFAIVEQLIADIQSGVIVSPITNLTGSCIEGDNTAPTSICYDPFVPSPDYNTVPDSFLFYDNLHFSEAFHTELAHAFAAEIAPAPVPLPAGGLLLIGGLGAFVALRHARKAAA
jgi:phospholipase/lecithinase/hemolysin